MTTENQPTEDSINHPAGFLKWWNRLKVSNGFQLLTIEDREIIAKITQEKFGMIGSVNALAGAAIPKEESGWLVETEADGHPCWLAVSGKLGLFWVKDSLEAIRFTRKEDAEAMALLQQSVLYSSFGCEIVATEHIWTDRKTEERPQQKSGAESYEELHIFTDDSISDQSVALVQEKEGKTTGISFMVSVPPGISGTEIVLTKAELELALKIVSAEHDLNVRLGYAE